MVSSSQTKEKEEQQDSKSFSFTDFFESVTKQVVVSKIIVDKALRLIHKEMDHFEGDRDTRLSISASVASKVFFSFIESLNDLGVSKESQNKLIDSFIKQLIDKRQY